jgi:flagellar hook-basal body complex protein FliE
MEIPTHIASQLYANAQAAARPAVGGGGGGFETSFAELAANFLQSMRRGEETAKQGMLGKADAHSVVEALAATEVAVQTAVSVRDRVVEAYQEILRMPV